MSKAQLVITAVVLEGRSKSEVARDYDLSRFWVHQLVNRYHADGRRRRGNYRRSPRHRPDGADRAGRNVHMPACRSLLRVMCGPSWSPPKRPAGGRRSEEV